MDDHLVWLLIALVIGVIVSNLMVLKYSAKFKWPGTKSSEKKDDSETDHKDKQD